MVAESTLWTIIAVEKQDTQISRNQVARALTGTVTTSDWSYIPVDRVDAAKNILTSMGYYVSPAHIHPFHRYPMVNYGTNSAKVQRRLETFLAAGDYLFEPAAGSYPYIKYGIKIIPPLAERPVKAALVSPETIAQIKATHELSPAMQPVPPIPVAQIKAIGIQPVAQKIGIQQVAKENRVPIVGRAIIFLLGLFLLSRRKGTRK